MQPLREWLFRTVADELTLKGYNGINFKQIAGAGGMSVEQVRSLFPDQRSLMTKLVDEISEAQKDFILPHLHEKDPAEERIIQFITRSLDFSDNHPNLVQVIVLALLGNDPEVKEHVHEVYGRLFDLILDDLVRDGVIPVPSFPVLSDLTEVLLSVIFLGGCPRLQMDYLSFIDPRKVAISTLSAMRKRYAVPMN
jgi:AcrR family transcriptional regulator